MFATDIYRSIVKLPEQKCESRNQVKKMTDAVETR